MVHERIILSKALIETHVISEPQGGKIASKHAMGQENAWKTCHVHEMNVKK
jgi:hypothetical protein